MKEERLIDRLLANIESTQNIGASGMTMELSLSDALVLADALESERTTAPATTPDTSQDWAKLDGAQAFHLIERHADGWAETGNMMESWLAARMGAAPVSLTDEAIEEIWKAIPTKEFQDGEKLELFSYAKAKRLEFARALLAAAPAPIQQPQDERTGFEAWQREKQGWLYTTEAEEGTFQEERWVAWQARAAMGTKL